MSDGAPRRWWVVDGNNVYGSRPDGWWNDRPAAAGRFAQRVAEWCRTHDEEVTVVFDPPVAAPTLALAGGNLSIVEAPRRGRDAADDHIVDLVETRLAELLDGERVAVVTADKGLRDRLPPGLDIIGVGEFRNLVHY